MVGIQLPAFNPENLPEVSDTLVFGWLILGVNDSVLVDCNNMAYFQVGHSKDQHGPTVSGSNIKSENDLGSDRGLCSVRNLHR